MGRIHQSHLLPSASLDHSTESLGMARRLMSTMDTLFRASLLLGLLLAISGAASPWGGDEGESQLASHQSPFASNGVRSVMKRGAGVVKRKSDKKSGKGGDIKENKAKEKKKSKLKREKNKKRKNGKKRNGEKRKKKKIG